MPKRADFDGRVVGGSGIVDYTTPAFDAARAEFPICVANKVIACVKHLKRQIAPGQEKASDSEQAYQLEVADARASAGPST